MPTNKPSSVPEQFVKVSSTGLLLPKSAAEWEGVYDPATNLVWGRALLRGAASWETSMEKVGKALLCGLPARAGSIRERITIINFDRAWPALYTDYFAPESGWEWTGSECKNEDGSPSGDAWVVFLGDGLCYRALRGDRFLVRPVLAGQLFSFGSSTVQP